LRPLAGNVKNSKAKRILPSSVNADYPFTAAAVDGPGDLSRHVIATAYPICEDPSLAIIRQDLKQSLMGEPALILSYD
jgi:hypothetical protein